MTKQTTSSSASEVETECFKVISNLHHNTKLYRPGAKVSLTAAQAAPLLKSGVIAVLVSAK